MREVSPRIARRLRLDAEKRQKNGLTQPICAPCWRQRNPGRPPVRFIPVKVEVCAFCDGLTTMGIYVRKAP